MGQPEHLCQCPLCAHKVVWAAVTEKEEELSWSRRGQMERVLNKFDECLVQLHLTAGGFSCGVLNMKEDKCSHLSPHTPQELHRNKEVGTRTTMSYEYS